MRHIAFALDPDGYWVEIIGQKPVEETENIKETNVSTYRLVSGFGACFSYQRTEASSRIIP
jgi:hypothetical protein